ncbi:putative secreted protein (Por secretion system target) [Mariniflexile fucanivorans]|uniref:Putative secreted protein (Por secretion system target) n=1 Tax=Mariniflexile fucanivorans TaxID=264023 RepID=A0A4R1RCB4_9FLAO|nr:T9SS type A sorting domain-containing protein [Mariniflexile fucanivorans]TCL63416.1 putative secreted protein (Por secretion system target) [Mariniflexile fucanivorans]
MKNILTLVVFVLATFSAKAQISNITEKFALPSTLSESSGAIFFNNKLITHNDSGGENKLYELDTISGQITRTVTILNATNTDWEDITQDETSIYIGDIGNNSGDRTNLKIYKINKTDYTSQTSVDAETINFNYLNQTDFTSNLNNTEWDAEALVSFDDTHLMVFSKNWVNNITKAYLIPKTPGSYPLTALDASLNSGGLITGGTYNPFTGKLYLIGFSNILLPFIWVCTNFNGSNVFSGTNTKTQLSSLGFEQAEAITFINENKYFITSESFSQNIVSDYAKLMSFSTNDIKLTSNGMDANEKHILYPNPVINDLTIKSAGVQTVQIYDTKLSQLYKGTQNVIDMGNFSKGVYFVRITTDEDNLIIKKVVKN